MHGVSAMRGNPVSDQLRGSQQAAPTPWRALNPVARCMPGARPRPRSDERAPSPNFAKGPACVCERSAVRHFLQLSRTKAVSAVLLTAMSALAEVSAIGLLHLTSAPERAIYVETVCDFSDSPKRGRPRLVSTRTPGQSLHPIQPHALHPVRSAPASALTHLNGKP